MMIFIFVLYARLCGGDKTISPIRSHSLSGLFGPFSTYPTAAAITCYELQFSRRGGGNIAEGTAGGFFMIDRNAFF